MRSQMLQQCIDLGQQLPASEPQQIQRQAFHGEGGEDLHQFTSGQMLTDQPGGHLAYAKALYDGIHPGLGIADLQPSRGVVVFHRVVAVLQQPRAGAAIGAAVEHGLHVGQRFQRIGQRACLCQITGRTAENAPLLPQKAVADGGRPGVAAADAYRNINAFFGQVDKTVGQRDLRLHAGVLAHEIEQQGHDPQAAIGGWQIDAQLANGRRAFGLEYMFGFFQVAQDLLAGAVEGLTGIGQCQPSCGALQQPHAQSRFQPCHGLANGGVGQIQALGSGSEAAGIDDADKHINAFEAFGWVHGGVLKVGCCAHAACQSGICVLGTHFVRGGRVRCPIISPMQNSLWQRVLPSLAVLGSVTSLCLGTSFAKHLFPVVGSQGTTALRVGFSALLLLAIWRPWRFGPTKANLKQIALFGAVLGMMNLLFYIAIGHLPFGVTVAIEFVGPLSVAVLTSRRWLDFVWLGLAVAGLFMLLVLPLLGVQVGSLDPVGILFAVGAATCWAGYIVLGKRAGRLHGGMVVSLGLLSAAVVVVPFGIAKAGSALLTPSILLYGLAVAAVSSAIPYSLEMFALKRLSHGAFSTMLATEPAIAALAGMVVLGEQLSPVQWGAIALIMLAAMGSALTARPAGQGG